MSLPKNYKIINWVPVSKETLPKIRVSKLMRDGHGKCVKCGIQATRVITYTLASESHKIVYSNIFASTRMLTADHVLPRALGGADALSNLQLMCCKCNHKKGIELTLEEIERIIQNRRAHIRSTFTTANMRYVINRFPSLVSLYDLAEPEGPALPFGRTYFSEPSGSRIKRIKELSYGLVNNKHPHHPMWGWVRIFEMYPDIKPAVRFTA